MCSRSTGDMLNQNWRAWLKWSSNDAGLARTLAASATRTGTSRNAPVIRSCEEGAAAVQRVGLVRRDAAVDRVLVEAVAQHVVDRCMRAVDRDLREVRPAQPGQLGVDVGEQAGLHQRVVGDVDPGRQMTDVEGDLLGLREEVGRVGVEGGRPIRCTAASSSGTILVGSSRSMPANIWSSVSSNTWMPSSHCGNAPASMASAQVATVEVGVESAQHLSLLPGQRVHAEEWLPVELHQATSARARSCTGRCARRTPPSSGRSAGMPRSDMAHISVVLWPRCGGTRSPRTCRARLGLRDLAVRVAALPHG